MANMNPVGWFEIYVDDMPRATRFYETVFQLSLSELPAPNSEPIEMMAFPSNQEAKATTAGALVKMEGMTAGGNATIVYFVSDDCSVEEGRVVAAGGKVFSAKTSLGDYGFASMVYDTEGNMIGIHSMK